MAIRFVEVGPGKRGTGEAAAPEPAHPAPRHSAGHPRPAPDELELPGGPVSGPSDEDPSSFEPPPEPKTRDPRAAARPPKAHPEPAPTLFDGFQPEPPPPPKPAPKRRRRATGFG